MVVKVGIIGFRNHAARLYNLVQNCTESKIYKIFHPSKNFDLPECTNNFSDLYDCDAIIIASPNQSHFEYIEKLISEFSGYIFCEKPPVTTQSQLSFLKNIPNIQKEKIFFNFNYRFSNMNLLIKEYCHSENFGQISHINIISTKGLAYKNDYLNSWRADGNTNLHNILDTVSIHYLDLLFYNFGKIKSINYVPVNISKRGTSYDACHLVLEFQNGLTASIFNSYSSPYVNELLFVGTNGYMTIRNNELILFSPRDSYNENNFFKTPPIYDQTHLSMEEDYEISLRRSIDYFISIVKNNSIFELKLFETSIHSNQIILNLHEENQ